MEPTGEKKVTIKDVARNVGVCTATVSHALRGNRNYVSQSTIDRIGQEAAKLGYVPNETARSLRRSQKGAVGIRDVARRSGFSITTVSNALNEVRSVSPETRKLIKDVAGEMGYEPNPAARNMRKVIANS